MNLKVSTITCVYNGGKYISKLLDSALIMGYPNIEHIIITDGSANFMEEVVTKYIQLYKNKDDSSIYMEYIRQEYKGLVGATNDGLKNVACEYWACINCDDWYKKFVFFDLVKLLNKHLDIDCIHLNGYFKYNPGNKETIFIFPKKLHPDNNKRFFVEYYFSGYFRNSLCLVRTSAYKSINSSILIMPIPYTQDIQLVRQIFSSLKGMMSPKECLNFNYREDSHYFKNEEKLDKINKDIHFESLNQLLINKHDKESLLRIVEENYVINLYNFFAKKVVSNQHLSFIKGFYRQGNK